MSDEQLHDIGIDAAAENDKDTAVVMIHEANPDPSTLQWVKVDTSKYSSSELVDMMKKCAVSYRKQITLEQLAEDQLEEWADKMMHQAAAANSFKDWTADMISHYRNIIIEYKQKWPEKSDISISMIALVDIETIEKCKEICRGKDTGFLHEQAKSDDDMFAKIRNEFGDCHE